MILMHNLLERLMFFFPTWSLCFALFISSCGRMLNFSLTISSPSPLLLFTGCKHFFSSLFFSLKVSWSLQSENKVFTISRSYPLLPFIPLAFFLFFSPTLFRLSFCSFPFAKTSEARLVLFVCSIWSDWPGEKTIGKKSSIYHNALFPSFLPTFLLSFFSLPTKKKIEESPKNWSLGLLFFFFFLFSRFIVSLLYFSMGLKSKGKTIENETSVWEKVCSWLYFFLLPFLSLWLVKS